MEVSLKSILLSAGIKLNLKANIPTVADIAEHSRLNKVYVSSVLLNRAKCSLEVAAKICDALETLMHEDFTEQERSQIIDYLLREPDRTEITKLKTDPLVYRLHEMMQVYGPAIKYLINEEFGDGILSAIDCKFDIKRENDRVKITIDSKFLKYPNLIKQE